MPVEVTHRVNFYDTDAMAVVHHANYIRWFEIGRVAYLRRIGITLGALMEVRIPDHEGRCGVPCTRSF